MEELLTAATSGLLRHIAAEEVTEEAARKEEERQRAEQERPVSRPRVGRVWTLGRGQGAQRAVSGWGAEALQAVSSSPSPGPHL